MDQELRFSRIDGRIKSDNLTLNEQSPIVLAKDGPLAPLLMKYAHTVAFKDGHAGTQLMLQYVRKKYWIMNARNLAKTIVKACPICTRLRIPNSEQLMAELPSSRTAPVKPFLRSGIDYAGPVTIRFNLGRAPKLAKAWIAVLVCPITRAIHLELVSDASTTAFIAAFRRMVGRKGRVQQVISDNGTNFVGANNSLKSIVSQMATNAPQIENELKINWTFTTPGAPGWYI